MLAATVLTLALVPSLYPHRTVVVASVAVVAVVLASLALTSPLAVAVAVVALAVAVAYSDGPSVAPTVPGYLAGRYRVRTTSRKAPTVTFTAPVGDDVAVTVDLSAPWAEADRLLACYSRALSSRHQTRAAGYWRRYCDLVRADRTATRLT